MDRLVIRDLPVNNNIVTSRFNMDVLDRQTDNKNDRQIVSYIAMEYGWIER